MSTTALSEGKDWYEKLMDAEHRGRKDNNGSARGRLADFIAVNESKLVRLEYKFEEMKDIGGELYRRLMLAYQAVCERNEAAADALRAERLKLKAKRNAAGLERTRAPVGMDTHLD